MSGIANSSSSPAPSSAADISGRLLIVPLVHVFDHPANANLMGEELMTKLVANIKREGDYPPLVVRPMPGRDGDYQILDGHQRREALRRLGYDQARCYVWPCDDRTALLLLTTLNRLEGQDEPYKRAQLLQELTALISVDELAQLVPEGASAIRSSLAMLDLNLEGLLADLTKDVGEGRDLRSISFAVSAADEQVIESAIARATKDLTGQNRRGRGLALLASRFLEAES